MTDSAHIVVTAAVIEREGGYLVARRLEGTHLAGCWEFPGGKCEPGEEAADCLTRELREELDVAARVGTEMLSTTHTYPERSVELRFFRCELADDPKPMLGQQLRWVRPEELASLEFPPADRELIDLLMAERNGRSQREPESST